MFIDRQKNYVYEAFIILNSYRRHKYSQPVAVFLLVAIHCNSFNVALAVANVAMN